MRVRGWGVGIVRKVGWLAALADAGVKQPRLATLPSSLSAGTMSRNGGEPGQRVTRVAKPYALRAPRSGPREEVLRW
jgi:hypothetical protein